MEMRDCSTCGQQRAFEAPACADGHDLQCPDLGCVECGEAIFLGPVTAQVTPASTAGSRVAPAA